MKIILTQNGAALNAPAGFRPDPEKGEAPRVQLEASGTERPCKETFDAPIVAQYVPTAKSYSTLQAQAARAGHELTQTRHETGLLLWKVSRWGQSRQFSEWSDVCAFVAHIGGARHA
jgi:hypothetical protein